VRRFFDTNVLVYSRDPDDAAKRAVARALIEEALEGESFVISTQVLVEFYATTVRRRLLGPAQALDLVRFWGGATPSRIRRSS
jgi:predicted nucleic acid-binding protein